MNSELDSPPFDPTPIEVAESGMNASPQYSILVRAYPESGQAIEPSSSDGFDGDSGSVIGLRRWLFGESRSDLRIKITGMQRTITDLLEGQAKRDKRIAILQKQVAIWEKTYETASELACQRIKDVALLRHQLNTANEEIERLAMSPKRKPGRPKKGTSGR